MVKRILKNPTIALQMVLQIHMTKGFLNASKKVLFYGG